MKRQYFKDKVLYAFDSLKLAWVLLHYKISNRQQNR